jgi:histidine triad (HIT) family protein
MITVPETSIFTKIINREIPGFIPYQTESIAVLIALEGHILIVPKQQYKDIFELPDEIAAEIMQTAVRVSKALKTTTNCEGVNLIQSNGAVAGQEVFHFHLHIKPRFKDDGIIFKWDTNTKPEIEREILCNEIKNQLTT